MATVVADGIEVDLPAGWEIAVDGGADEMGEASQQVMTPRVHIGNFSLPARRGDFGSGAVERMTAGNVMICLLEESAEAIGSELYNNPELPVLSVDDFAPEGMQRPIRGQSGAQAFFHQNGRAFAAYVVMGSHLHRGVLIDSVNAVLGSIVIEEMAG